MKVLLCRCDHRHSVSHRTVEVLSSAKGSENLVSNPAEADALLFVDFPSDEGFRDLLQHPLFAPHRKKSFLYSQDDIPIAFVPGLFGCTPRGWNLKSRARGAHFVQPFEARHEPEERERTLLFSFMGGPTGAFRKALLAHDFQCEDSVIVNTGGYRHWDAKQSQEEKEEWRSRYRDTMLASKFVLCPRGAGNGSIRLFEVMQMGRAPVILADGWLPPIGPNWNDFAIFIKEGDLESLPSVLEKHEAEAVERGKAAREAWDRWFRPEDSLNYLIDQMDAMRDADRTWDEPWLWSAFNGIDRARRAPRSAARNVLRNLKSKRRSSA